MPVDTQTRLAADHYPVVADITVPGSEVGIGRKQPTLPEPTGQESVEEVEQPDEAGVPPLQ